MKRIIVIIIILVSTISCTKQIVYTKTDTTDNKKSNSKYDYLLTEALRQKYFGDIKDAVALFQQCIEIDRNRSVPYYELAKIYTMAGLPEKAVIYAEKAANTEKENYWYQLASGSLFAQCGKTDSALYYLKKSTELEPNSDGANTIMAEIYSENGEVQKADSIFNLLYDRDLLTNDMFIVMISGLVNQGNVKEAERRTLKMSEKNPEEIWFKALLADLYYEDGATEKSDSIYKEIIESKPDDIVNQHLYLMNLVNKKEYNGIERFIKNVFESDIIERKQKLAIAEKIMEDTVYVKNSYDKIAECLEIMEKKYPDDEEIMSMRPEMYEIAGLKKEAIKRDEEILAFIKPAFYTKEKLILLYADQKEYKKLFELASIYSRDNNMSILGKVYYAIAATELNEYQIAENELKKAMILAGNNEQIKIQLLAMMGDLKYKMNDTEAAYKYYEEALKINPEETLVLNNYAYFLAEENRDLNKALKMAETVMKKEGSNVTYIDTYAWVLYKLKKYKAANKAMIEVFKNKEEESAELYEHMGYIKKALKDCNNAVKYWEKAIEIDNNKSNLKEEIEKCKMN